MAEKIGWKLDVPLAQRCVEELTNQQSSKIDELKNVMPKRKVTTKKSKPKVCFKKDGSPSSHGERWFALLDEHKLPRHYEGEVKLSKVGINLTLTLMIK